MTKLSVEAFFDQNTFTISYVAYDPETKVAAIIDPVMNFDRNSGRTHFSGADMLISFLQREGLTLDWILETHVHADHLTAAQYIKEISGGKIAIGANVGAVQHVFAPIFGVEQAFKTDGSQFDHLIEDGEDFMIGSIKASAMATPGHTPACMTYHIGDAAFIGDTMFMPDYGTARCDFPGGDAEVLYNSIQRILALPGETRLFMCHDYKAKGRDYYAWETTVDDQKANNIHVNDTISEQDFVAMRTSRDSQLDLPALIIPSVQINMRAGQMPPKEANGVRYIKTPIDLL